MNRLFIPLLLLISSAQAASPLQGVETVLVRVPGEPHGIIARPSHAISKTTTLHGWFERHSG